MYVLLCVWCVCVVTNTIYRIAIMLTSLQCLQSCGSQSWCQMHIKSSKAVMTIPCKFISRKPRGSRPQLFWAPWGLCLWYLGTSTIHHKRFESLSFQKKMNVTVLNSILVNCTLKSSIDCFLSTFICILGSLLTHSSNHWIQKKDTWSIERDKVFTNVFFFSLTC